MFDKIQKKLTTTNSIHHYNEGILIAPVKDQQTGVGLALALLYEIVDKKTAFYLSGGRTPKSLYERIAREEKMHPGAVGIVDERYGQKFHVNSNEKMIKNTGLLRYLEVRDVPFYPILQQNMSREETAEAYDQTLRKLNTIFPQSLAIMGIGADGHTAGLPAQNSKLKTQNSKIYTTYDFVAEFHDTSGIYGERVTMTFTGLSMMDVLIVLVFGDDKKEALEAMFTEGKEEEVPARFYKRPDVAVKTIIITDNMI